MKNFRSVALLIVLFNCVIGLGIETLDPSALVGTWEGESKCTIANSPCKDEHIIYEIEADKNAAGKVQVDAFKVVEGKQESMGRLDCIYRAGHILDCTSNTAKKDRWEFRVINLRMIGSLVVGDDRTLYGRLALHKR